MRGQVRVHLLQLRFVHGAQARWSQGCATAPQPLEHLALRGQHLAQLALHEDHLVRSVRRQLEQQHVDDLHDLALRLIQPSLVVAQSLDALVLEVPARIVGIGLALLIGQRFHASRVDHLHGHAGP